MSIISSLRKEYEMQHPTAYINPMAENTLIEILQQTTTLGKLILEATEQSCSKLVAPSSDWTFA